MRNKTLSRVPQDLAFHVDALDKTFGQEAPIIRDVLIYVSQKQMLNIFDEISFSISDFCKEFGYNRTYLQRTIQSLQESKIVPELDGHICDSYFEYALYRALKENVTFIRVRDGKRIITAINLFNRLEIDYRRDTEKKTKRIYTVCLGEKIFESLFSEYNLINIDEYKALRSSKVSTLGGLRNFYIYMGRIISNVQYLQRKELPMYFDTAVDELCDVFNISAREPKHKKQQITKYLNLLKEQFTTTQFDWKYEAKDSTKLLYYVRFQFSQETLEIFNEKIKAVFYKKIYSECLNFMISKSSDTILNYKERINAYQNIDKKQFFTWLQSDTDLEFKDKIFRKIFEEVYHYKYPNQIINFNDLIM